MHQKIPIWARDLPLLLGEIYAKVGKSPPDSDKRLFDLVEWVIRIPTRNPRKVHISDTLNRKILTPYERKGIGRLIKNLVEGRDLRPFLSRTTLTVRDRNASKKISGNDLFFSDWGLLHFHLGVDLANTGKHVSRTRRVLIAYLTEDDSYLIDVTDHGKGFADVWGNKKFLETLHRNWPHVIARYKLRGVSGLATDEPIEPIQYVKARQSGIAAVIEINGSVFMGPGMGIATDGTSIRAVDLAQKIQRELATAEKQFREKNPDTEAVLFVGTDASAGFFIPEMNAAYSYLPARNHHYLTPRFFKRIFQESEILANQPEGVIWTPPGIP